MEQNEKFALLLGMLSGDGCLPISHSGEGYRDYHISFCNTDKRLVESFQKLLFELFNLESKLLVNQRVKRKDLYYISKRSKEVYFKIRGIGFPEGVKRDVLRVPKIIKSGSKEGKSAFIYGFLITDGCLRKNKTILFHSGSKVFLEEISKLIGEFTKIIKPVREYVQREKYKSYQLNLNKKETEVLLEHCRRGTMVLHLP